MRNAEECGVTDAGAHCLQAARARAVVPNGIATRLGIAFTDQ